MAVQSGDIQIVQAQSQLGGPKGTTVATGVDNLFDTLTGIESDSGVVDYAVAYIENNSSQTAFNVRVFVSSEDAFENVNVSIANGNSAVGGSESAIPDNSTPPSVTFVEAEDVANAVALGDIPAGSHKAIWVRMTIPAGTSAVNYNYSLQVVLETEA